jgi:hypothetical protein
MLLAVWVWVWVSESVSVSVSVSVSETRLQSALTSRVRDTIRIDSYCLVEHI